MEKQSVRVGVDRFFYAPLISDNSTAASYGLPVALPGVTEVSLTLNSSIGTVYADDGIFETFSQDGDKEIAISLTGVSNDVAAYLTGASYSDTNGLMIDGNSDNPPYVAIGFRSQKSNGEYRYVWIYKGRFAKADSINQTKSAETTPQVEQYIFKATLRLYDNKWRQMMDSDDLNCPAGLSVALLNSKDTGWFSSPNFIPAAPGTPISDLAATTGSSTGEINLTFTAPTGAALVKAQVNTIAGWIDATTASEITGASTSAVVTGLTAGNTYEFRLRVIGGDSNGISNIESAVAGA